MSRRSKQREEIRDNDPFAGKKAESAADSIYQKNGATNGGSTSAAFMNMMKNKKALQEEEQKGNAILNIEKGIIEIRGCQMIPTGLVIPPNISEDDLEYVADVVRQLGGAIQWMMGDILAFSETVSYGDVNKIAEWLDRSPKTLSNWASVCEFFDNMSKTSQRREGLEFGHHEAIISLMKSDPEIAFELLDKAEIGDELEDGTFRRWSVARLRSEIAKEQGTESQKPTVFDVITRQTDKIEKRLPKLKPHEKSKLIVRLEGLLEKLKN